MALTAPAAHSSTEIPLKWSRRQAATRRPASPRAVTLARAGTLTFTAAARAAAKLSAGGPAGGPTVGVTA